MNEKHPLREFFTAEEIINIKNRIINECSLYNFLEHKEYKDEYGELIKQLTLSPAIKNEIEATTKKEIKEYVENIVNEVVKLRITEAVKKFNESLCEQLEKMIKCMIDKARWY